MKYLPVLAVVLLTLGCGAFHPVSNPTATPDLRPIDERLRADLTDHYIESDDLRLVWCGDAPVPSLIATCWRPANDDGFMLEGPSMTLSIFDRIAAYASQRGWAGVWAALSPYAADVLPASVEDDLLRDADFDVAEVLGQLHQAMAGVQSLRTAGEIRQPNGWDADYSSEWVAPDRSYTLTRRLVEITDAPDGGEFHTRGHQEMIAVGGKLYVREWTTRDASRTPAPGARWVERNVNGLQTAGNRLPELSSPTLLPDGFMHGDELAYIVTGSYAPTEGSVPFFAQVGDTVRVTFWVAKGTHRLLRVEIEAEDGTKTLLNYFDYNADITIEVPDTSE